MQRPTIINPRQNYCGTLILLFIIVCTGCSGKSDDKHASEPTKQSAPRTASSQIQDISDNPGFYTATAIKPTRADVKALDAVIMPVLKKVYGDAKLVSETPPSDWSWQEDLLEGFTYVVKRWFAITEDDELHAAFLQAGFNPSPRLGRKPSGGGMSFFKNAGGKTHTLVIKMEGRSQTIVVTSYKIGKYDHL
ncbi:MAG: hypothetical protein JW938_06735 [Candidatus Omnitrophica bacterium]|nr:hypothetical protein [Candidatus Omnitrophota bacterium]